MRHRRGTILLFVVGIVALITIMVYGFVRSLVLQRHAGQSTAMQLLAGQAAQLGAQHAAEQILRDAAQEAVTRFDGPARSPFRAHHRPFAKNRGQANPRDSRTIDLHDVSAENLLHEPMWWEQSDATAHTGCGDESYGQSFTQMMDGRGRWIEPGLHGGPVPHPLAGGTWLPALPVRFGDGDAVDADGAGWYDGTLADVGVYATRAAQNVLAKDAAVDVESDLLAAAGGARCAPLLLDGNLRRLPASTRAEYLEQRKWARYRLRYACEVRDLDGYLLVNPDLDADPRALVDADPRTYADPAARRLVQAMHAVPNLGAPLVALNGKISPFPARLQHVVAGRGSTANHDRISGADYWPRAFPLMYRGQHNPAPSANPTTTGTAPQWYWFLEGKGIINSSVRPWPPLTQADRLWQHPSLAAPAPAGGTLLPAGVDIMRHDLTGPQYSFFNLWAAVGGSDSGSQNAPSEHGADAAIGRWNSLIWLTTPFGRGLDGGGRGRYGGAVATPWHVNLLTAHPLVVRAIVLGSLPKGALQVRFAGGAGYRTLYSAVRAVADLHNAATSPAFARWAPPAHPTTGVAPEYRMDAELPGEPGFRPPWQRYPGPLLPNGVAGLVPGWYAPPAGTLASDAVADGIGSALAVDAQAWSFDPHAPGNSTPGSQTANWPYLLCPQRGSGSVPDVVGAATPPPLADLSDSTRYPNWRLQTNDASAWSDILRAFNAALAVARRGHARFESEAYQARDGDAWHADPLCRPMDLRAFDRLFIMCLGHDPDAPGAAPVGAGHPHRPWGGNPPAQYTLAANLATLAADPATVNMPDKDGADRAATWRLRTQAAELAINDLRFSLLGSSPGYSRDFRPLDLNGDGVVAFSGYAPGRYSGAADEGDRAAFLVDQDCAATADPLWPSGAGEWAADGDGDGQLSLAEFRAAGIEPFCVAGNFFIGRSRYWHVIVRGELWDNLRQVPAAQVNQETVLVVDQAEQAEPWPGAPGTWNAQRAYSTQVLFQRRHFNINIARQARNH